MAQELKINGTTIKTPNKFDYEAYNLTKSGRVASGEMTMDLVAKKRKFLLNYTVISGKNLAVILGLIDTSSMFFTLTYKDNDVSKSAVCYVGAIKKTQFRTDSGAWYYKDCQFDLIEK